MALDLTKMTEAAIRAQRMYQQYENRFSSYGAFEAYRQGGEALLPKSTIERLKSAQNYRDLVFPVLQKRDIAVITANACSFTGAEDTSAKPSFSYVTRGFAIRVYPKVCENNYISEEDVFAQGLTNGIRSVLSNLDAYAVAQLEANKNTDLETTTLNGVSVAANAYVVTPTEAEKLYFLLPTLAELNDVNVGSLVNVCSVESRSRMLEYESKSAGNDQNLAGVLAGSLPSATGYRHHRTKNITNGGGVAETHYIVPFGGIGLFTFIDSEARKGMENGPDNKKKYAMADPILGIDWGVTEKPICSDLNATYGAAYTEVHGMEYRFVAEFAFMNAYSSDTTSPIHKVELQATA